MNTSKQYLLIIMLLPVLLTGCFNRPIDAVVQPAETAAPEEAKTQTMTPTPDYGATEEADRFKATVQAFQTETAAEKATERTGGTPAPQAARIEPISISNLDRLSSFRVDIDPIYAAKFSTDGNAAALLNDGKLIVLNLITLEPLAELGEESYNSLSFANGNFGFTAALFDNSIHVQLPDLENTNLTGHDDAIIGLAFTPNNDILLSSSLDNTIRVWDLKTMDLLQTHSIEKFSFDFPPNRIWFSSDLRQTAFYNTENSAVWVGEIDSLTTEAPRGEVFGWFDHAGPVADVYFDSPWSRMAWISRGTIQLMDLSGDYIGEAIQHEDWIGEPLFSTGLNSLILTNSESTPQKRLGTINRYDLESGELLSLLEESERSSVIVLTTDGQKAATGNFSGVVSLWDLALGNQVFTTNTSGGSVSHLIFSNDETVLISLNQTGDLTFFATLDGNLAATLPAAIPAESFSWSTLNSTGDNLAIILENGTVIVYRVSG